MDLARYVGEAVVLKDRSYREVARAHGVLRRKFNTEGIVGSFFRKLIRIRLASPGQPYLLTSRRSIISSVTPWSGSFGCS